MKLWKGNWTTILEFMLKINIAKVKSTTDRWWDTDR